MGLIKKEIKKGEYICFQGEESDSIFVLEKGIIDVLKVENEETVTKETVETDSEKVDIIEQPDSLIGEIGVFLNKPRVASLRAQTDVTISVIPVEEGMMKKIIESKREIGYKIIKDVIIRIQRTSRSIYNIEKDIIKYYDFIKSSISTFQNIINKLSETDNMEIEKFCDILTGIKSKYEYTLDTYENYLKFKDKTNENPNRINYNPGDVLISFGDYKPNYFVLGDGEVLLKIGTKSIFKCSDKYALFGNYFDLFDPKAKDNDNTSYFTVIVTKPSKIKSGNKESINKSLENNIVLAHFGEIFSKNLSTLASAYYKSKREIGYLKNELSEKNEGILFLHNILKPIVENNRKIFDKELINQFDLIKKNKI